MIDLLRRSEILTKIGLLEHIRVTLHEERVILETFIRKLIYQLLTAVLDCF